MASIFQIGISQNTKCALTDDFYKSSHIYGFLLANKKEIKDEEPCSIHTRAVQ